MARILLTGGFGMALGDSSAYWTLADIASNAGHEVRLCECIQTGSPENKVTLADLLWADVHIVYSYGCASLWHLSKNAQLAPRPLLIIVAGVADIGLGQIKLTLWHAPDAYAKAVCFNVSDEPISSYLQNAGAVFVNIGTPIPDARWVNVDCNLLFPAFSVPSYKHIAVKESPAVLRAIADLILAIPAAPDYAGKTPPAPALIPPSAPAADDAAGAHAGNMEGGA